MSEFLYGIGTGVIAIGLLAGMAIAMEVGHRLGRRFRPTVTESGRSQVNTILGSVLGILALLLGFTLSLSLQRFDSRSAAVVDEASAVGTALQYSELLPEPDRAQVRALLVGYVDLRLRSSDQASLLDKNRTDHARQTERLQAQLWGLARHAAQSNPDPVRTGLFAQSVSSLIDCYARREAALRRHVPELVLVLLYSTFLMAGGLLGYSSGLAGHRPSGASYVLVVLIVVLVFIIVDLDRPRRGLITVSQQSMLDLQSSLSRP